MFKFYSILIFITVISCLANFPQTAFGSSVTIKHAFSSTSHAAVFSQSITVSTGSTIIAACVSNGGVAINSVTDGINTYTLDKSVSSNNNVNIYRSSNVNAGTYNVTCNLASGYNGGIMVAEYTGLSNSSPLDSSNGAGGWATAPNGGSITANSTTWTSDWTQTPSTSQHWATAIVAYKAISGNDLVLSVTSTDYNGDITYTAPTNMAVQTQYLHSASYLGMALADNNPTGIFAPNISNIQVTNITTTSATVSWVTALPATSQVIMVLSDSPQPYKRFPEPMDNTLVTNHTVNLTDLIPNTPYNFFVASKDQYDTLMVSYGSLAPDGQGVVSTFTTTTINAGAPLDFRFDLSGGKNVYAGSDLYVAMSNVLLAGSVDHVTITGVTGLPSGTSFHVICAYNPTSDESQDSFTNSSGQQWCWNGNSSTFSGRLRTSAGTPPGNYAVDITEQSGTVTKTSSYTFTVSPAPGAVAKQSVSSIPPIPGLAKWESNMTTIGQKWFRQLIVAGV